MVWSCFCKDKVRPLVLIEERLNATKYVKLLEQHLLPFLNKLKFDDYIFQDDNALAHSAHLTSN